MSIFRRITDEEADRFGREMADRIGQRLTGASNPIAAPGLAVEPCPTLTIEKMREICGKFRDVETVRDWRLVGFTNTGGVWQTPLDADLVAWLAEKIKEYLKEHRDER